MIYDVYFLDYFFFNNFLKCKYVLLNLRCKYKDIVHILLNKIPYKLGILKMEFIIY